VDVPHIPRGVRIRGPISQIGGDAITDLIVDLLVAKYQQWRHEKKLKERLAALQPAIEIKMGKALTRHLSDPWGPGNTKGQYYNVYLRIVTKTTVWVGGGHAGTIQGSPTPELVGVSISDKNRNELISEQDTAKVPGLSEGATGGVVNIANAQYVVYSVPAE